MLNTDEYFMQIALDFAWQYQTLALPNPSVCALVVKKNAIIALGVHAKSGNAHAEVMALKNAFLALNDNDAKNEELKKITDSHRLHDFLMTNHNNIFKDCDIFVTLEPCSHYGKTPPCANLLKEIKPSRIIIATKDLSTKAKGGIDKLSGIDIVYGILKAQADDLLLPFLCMQKYDSFNLFKIAHDISGNYKHGFISNFKSQIFTHNIRSVCDNIAISSKTLIEDNPRLDNRFKSEEYNDNLSNIFILTKHYKNLNEIMEKNNINLNIKDRNVKVCDMKNLILNGFSLIEGGFNFLNIIKDSIRIDMILGYIAPNITSLDGIKNVDIKCDLLHSSTLKCTEKSGPKNTNNILYWLKINE